jgi:NAD(P)-dependent dehydrogenase (short-subunit alcohol dehydrogenase family)
MQINAINLQDRVAIITGGAQGIGYAIATRFLQSGARLVLWDVNAGGLHDAVHTLSAGAGAGRVRGDVVDIADLAQVEAAVARTLKHERKIDILINNAAIVGPNTTLAEYPVDAWRQVIDVGINGTFHCCRAVVATMSKQGYGRIVNLSSIAGKEGNPNAAAYSSAKAAVIAMTKSLGKEMAGQDIAVNCVTPAVARTPGAMEQSPDHIKYMLSKIPRARFLELDEAAAMIAWLASQENSFTTGAVFDLSGGRATY